MGTSLEKLQQLQKIFSEKYEVSRRLRELPKQLSSKTEVVARLKKDIKQRGQVLSELEEQYRILKLSLEDIQKKRHDSENRMSLIKTQREFEILEKEIGDASSGEEQIRKEVSRKQKQIDELKQELETDIIVVKTQQEELIVNQDKMEQTITQDKERIKDLEKMEKRVSPDMDPDLMYKIETIVQHKEGLGIVPVRGSVCRGCNIVLPSQFVNEVRAAEEIKFCPSCSRVLYYEIGGEDFSQVLFDDNELGGLSDLIDEDDIEEDMSLIVEPDLPEDYEDR